jgi:hypothetical protein
LDGEFEAACCACDRREAALPFDAIRREVESLDAWFAATVRAGPPR